MKKPSSGFGTRAIHAGQPADPQTGAVMTPVYQTSTFAQSSPGKHKGYEYARTHNPTRTAYQECLASLEEGKFGIAYSSGLAAIESVLHTLSPGDHVVCSDDVYGGSYRIFEKVFKKFGISFSYVDMTKLDETKKAFTPKTKLVWIETPTNPLLKIIDIEAVSKIAHQAKALVAVDNTFMSSYFQKPLLLGADIALHSVTKFMNGHSDVVGGAIVVKDPTLHERLQFLQNAVGAVPGPWDCFLVMRGLKTLHVRMERHHENALKVAEFLEAHPQVDRVSYPGLKSHPQYQLAQKQMSGAGGIVSFYLKGGLKESKKFAESLKVFTLAESLGGVESLVDHPAIMTHASVPEASRKKLGITDSLIRLSVGIEDAQDLLDDLKSALKMLR